MVGLQGHWGERFGGTFLDVFSLRHACRATGGSVLEEFLCFGVVAALILARPAGPLGRAFWRCIFGWLLATPKLYHHYGLQGRRSWPQDGSRRSPTWRLFFARAWLWLSCRATGESVLEVHFCMIFRNVVLAGPLGRAFWRSFCVLGVVLAVVRPHRLSGQGVRGALRSAAMQIALLGGGLSFRARARGYGWAAGPLGRALWRYIVG